MSDNDIKKDEDKIQPNEVPLIGADDITDPNTGNRLPIIINWQLKVEVGDILQLSPTDTENLAFAGCFLVVTETFGWGVEGYVPIPGPDRDTPGGVAYYRATWPTVEQTNGKAVWLADGGDDE